jgi:hypothetical protein
MTGYYFQVTKRRPAQYGRQRWLGRSRQVAPPIKLLDVIRWEYNCRNAVKSLLTD